MIPKTRYVTTPIYYVNDRPHIGHVYTTTLCDVYARAMRSAGHDVFFLTGTDEHGVKVEESAAKQGVTPQELADENSAIFESIMGMFSLTNDAFIRTTDPKHEAQVQSLVSRLLESGDVYLGDFEGWYDAGQEEYHTENSARELDYTSPISGNPLVRATEKNYYFRLSAYQERLETLFEACPEFVRPEGRRNEVLGRLREGLQDVPISRTNFTWGVPMPNDAEHVIYVWIDALFNYITALGLGDPTSQEYKERQKYWPASFHVMAKEILWFHAVIWPAILMALDLSLPHCIYAHSFWVSEGRKMSKSLGNFVDLETIESYIETYGMDALRYYLVTQGPLGASDADFASEKFHDIYNAHLVNTFGNCASRVTAMIQKYFDGAVPTEGADRIEIANTDWPTICKTAVSTSLDGMEKFSLQEAIDCAMSIVRQIDSFINETAPFKLAKDETKHAELGAILYQCLEALRIASVLLHPVIPSKIDELHKAIGVEMPAGDVRPFLTWGGIQSGSRVVKVALFPRVERTVPSDR
ncbi:MAG: methionine--tRNA ligase [Phycisphaerales bacterium]|jgi:methionine--tRNA ligase|nr:methionine--tRNA ligase [Phycisphaerales bacterium]